MLPPIVTQSGPTQHSDWAYLSGFCLISRTVWCPGKDSDLQVIDRTALRSNRASHGGPRHTWRTKKQPGLRRPGENHAGMTLLYASHQLSSVGRTYRRSIFGEGIRRRNKEKRISLRAKSGAVCLPLLSETSRLVHHSPAVRLGRRQCLDRAEILRATGLAAVP